MNLLLAMEKFFENFPLGSDATLLLSEGAEAILHCGASSIGFGAVNIMLDGRPCYAKCSDR